MDPSPRAPLAPPGAAKTPGPEGDRGASSPRGLDRGLGLAGRGLHGDRPRCGRAVRLCPRGRGVGRGLRAAGSLGLRPGLRPRSCGQYPGAGHPTLLPGAAHPARPGLGREREGGREGVVGEGPWGPQGRVPGPPARAAPGRLPQAPGRSQSPASRASSLRPKGSPRAVEAWLGEADPSCCCLHFVSCSAWSVVVVVVWVWGAAGQGGSPAATSARGLGPRRPPCQTPQVSPTARRG